MQEEIIKFETAKLAKGKGFNNGSAHAYDSNSELIECFGFFWNDEEEGLTFTFSDYTLIYEAPTQSSLHKWLRDNHNIFIEITLASDYELNILIPFVYQFNVHKDGISMYDREFYDSYEEVLEIALQEALKLI